MGFVGFRDEFGRGWVFGGGSWTALWERVRCERGGSRSDGCLGVGGWMCGALATFKFVGYDGIRVLQVSCTITIVGGWVET